MKLTPNINRPHLQLFQRRTDKASSALKAIKQSLDLKKAKLEHITRHIKILKRNTMDNAEIAQLVNCGGIKLSQRITKVDWIISQTLHKNIPFRTTENLIPFKEGMGKKYLSQQETLESRNFNISRVPVNQIVIENYKKIKDLECLLSHQIVVRRKQERNKKSKELIGYFSEEHSYVTLFKCEDQEMYIIDHPSILPVLGVYQLQGQGKYIVTDYFEGSTLADMLAQFKELEEVHIKIILREILVGLSYLHSHRLAHNRLGLDTFVYDKEGRVLLNNFMSSKKPLSETEKTTKTHFYPPEMLLSKNNNYSEKNDIWAVGCIALLLLSRCPLEASIYHPYNKSIPEKKSEMTNSAILIDNVNNMYIKRENQQLTQSRQIQLPTTNLSPNAIEFVTKCLTVQADKRPSIQLLVLHPFFKK